MPDINPNDFWLALYEDEFSDSERGLVGVFPTQDDAMDGCEPYGKCFIYHCTEEIVVE